MAKQLVLKGDTSRIEYIFVQNSSLTTGAGLTGLAFNTASLVAYYVRTQGSATAITLATQTVTGAFSSGGFVEVDATNMPGVYRVDIPDACFASGQDKVVVMLKGATNMAPVTLEYQLVNFDPEAALATPTNITAGTITTATNVTTLNGIAANVITAASIASDAITAAKIATAALTAAKFAAGAIDAAAIADGAIDAATFAAGAINAAAIAADAITDAKVAADVTIASVTGSVGSVTGAVGSVTGAVGSVAAGGIAAASFAAGAINAAAIAADAITDAKVASDVTIASVTGAVGSVTGNVGGNVVGSVGSVVGAVGSVTGAVGSVTGLTASNLDTTVSSRATPAQILTTALTEAYAADGAAPTLAQFMFQLWSALSEFAVAGTTITAKKLDGTTTAMTFTLDDGTNPTSRTRAT